MLATGPSNIAFIMLICSVHPVAHPVSSPDLRHKGTQDFVNGLFCVSGDNHDYPFCDVLHLLIYICRTPESEMKLT